MPRLPRSLRTAIVSVLLALLAACGGDAVSESGPDRDWSSLAATLDAALADGEVAGYSFMLIGGNGTLTARAGGNIAFAQPIELASASKLPTVLALLTLVDDGLLALDQPIADYLAQDRSFIWPADKAAITLRMLIAHTAGIVGLADRQPDCLLQERETTLRACAQVIADTPLIAAPGSGFNYGGADLQVAAYVATLVTGQSWQQLFAERIAGPLGMSRTSYGDPATVTNPRVAGGAMSSAPDYARLLALLLDDGVHRGQRLLSSAMVAEVLRDQIAGLPIVYAPFPPNGLADFPGYGLGVFISAPGRHPGSAGPEYSDPGLFGATPWFDVALGYGAVLLIRDGTATGLSLMDRLRPSIIRELTTPPG